MGDGNGITAMLAHKARVGDDNIFVRGMIGSYTFLTYGMVEKYKNGRVDVKCGQMHFTNVEVIVFGVNGWGIKPVPAVDDRVLLVSSQSPIPDLKKFEAPGSMPAYDVSGLKAIPVTDSDTAQLITVDKDGVVLTGNNKLTINDDGIQIEDNNGNKVIASADGVSFEDTNGNKVDTTDAGVAFEDLNGNKVTADDQGIVVEDLNSNKYTSDSNGIILEDTNGNKYTADSNGIILEDTNGNKYTGKSSGIEIEDKNGCKIVSSSSSIKINDKLEIKK